MTQWIPEKIQRFKSGQERKEKVALTMPGSGTEGKPSFQEQLLPTSEMTRALPSFYVSFCHFLRPRTEDFHVSYRRPWDIRYFNVSSPNDELSGKTPTTHLTSSSERKQDSCCAFRSFDAIPLSQTGAVPKRKSWKPAAYSPRTTVQKKANKKVNLTFKQAISP